MGRGVDYRRILVALSEGSESEEAMVIACGLVAERGASVTAIAVIEVPAELPLDAHMVEEQRQAELLLSESRAIAELYGVNATAQLVRARASGEAIVGTASSVGAEIIVLRAALSRSRGNRLVYGRTATYVLKHAPCRVMVTTPRAAA